MGVLRLINLPSLTSTVIHNPLQYTLMALSITTSMTHWEEAIAVVPLHFDYADNLTEADKVKTVLETVDALEKAYASYPDGEISISWTMRRNCVSISLTSDYPTLNEGVTNEHAKQSIQLRTPHTSVRRTAEVDGCSRGVTVGG